ncbi:MAG: hypothetical protein NT004_08075 [Bacteroidetes bacterium]|nr:hypothetical protein [Bacteroidota bacterium]
MTPLLLHENPFPGIRSYEINEDHLFFGREFQVGELIGKLSETRFLAIVGSSGCGKSSLIKAGLIPTLLKNTSGNLPTSWKLTIFRPADDPIGNLANALADAQASAETLATELRKGTDGLISVLQKSNLPGQANLIVIDQFEELFRFKKSRTSFHTILESSAFIELIITAVSQSEIPIYVVISMRTDFLDECTEFRGLSELINKGYYLVPRMNNTERRLAITGPITGNGGTISEELVQRLLDDVGDDPDQLPIMQHALMRTYNFWIMNRAGNQPIGMEHYTAIGTMKEALSVHLEEIYAELKDHKNKSIAEKLFKALTDITKESRGTRRPTQLSEICTLANAREEEMIRIIDSFRKSGCAFLMPSSQVALNADSTIDISHESIMRIWIRLNKWVEEESQAAQLYLRLSKSAELYQDGKTGLWVNPELQLALQWKDQSKPNATWAMRYDPAFDRAMTFLDYSKKQHEFELSKKDKQQKRNLKTARNSAIILGFASIISILFLIISLNLRFKAEASRKEALEKEKLAVSESKRTEEQRKEAILQKKISEQQQQIAEQQEMITEQQRQYAVKQQIIAQEQTTVAVDQRKQADQSKKEALVARDEAQSQRKEAVTQKQIADKERIKAEESEKKTQRLRLLAISRSMAIQAGQLFNTVKDDLPALLAVTAFELNAANGGIDTDPAIYYSLSAISKDETVMRGHEDAVRAIAITKNGKSLFSCSDDGKALMWDLDNPLLAPVRIELMKHENEPLRAIGISHDEQWVICGTVSGKLLLWNRNTGKPLPSALTGHSSIINGIAIHPSLEQFASCGSDGLLFLWRYNNGTFTKQLLDSNAVTIHCLAFSPDGKNIAYGTISGIVKIIGINGYISSPAIRFTFNSPVLSLAYANNGKALAAGCSDGSIQICNPAMPGSAPHEIIGRHVSGVTGLTFKAMDDELASCSFDWSIKIAGFPSLEVKPISIDKNDLWVYDIIYTPDNKHIISSSADKTIRIFSTENGDMAEKLKMTLKRNMTIEEWHKLVGEDIPYQKTRSDLP